MLAHLDVCFVFQMSNEGINISVVDQQPFALAEQAQPRD
jgi:hypothetical protein